MGLFKKSDEQILSDLTHNNKEKRREAISQVRERKISAAIEGLLSLMEKETDSYLIVDAGIAILAFDDVDAYGKAVDITHNSFLREKERYVKAHLADGLGYLGSPLYLNDLFGGTHSPWPEVRWSSRRALSNIGLPWTLKFVQDGLDERDDLTRQYAIDALGSLGHPLSFFELTKLLGSPNITDDQKARDSILHIAKRIMAAINDPNPIYSIYSDEDLDMISRLITDSSTEYAQKSAQNWIERHNKYILHLLKDECIEAIAAGMTKNPDAFSFTWSESALGGLYEYAKSSGYPAETSKIKKYLDWEFLK